jgi:hypothetical protein
MTRHARTMTCSDCASPITRMAKTGRCRPCASRRMHADPAYQAKRMGGLQRFFDQPGAREERSRILHAGLKNWRANMTPEQKRRATEHGKWLIQRYLSRPEIHARSQTPEARARAVAAYVEKRLGWCPVDRRDEYRALIRNHVPAAEARRIIEAEIPGTREHALREISNIGLAARLRRERDLAEAY